MKKFLFTLALVASTLQLMAYERDTTGVFPIVSGGLKIQANTSNFLMKNVPTHPNLRSTMNAGGEFGGFIDFNITPHFFIQFNLMGVAEQCDIHNGDKHDNMWTIGLEIPVYLLGRYGNPKAGYVYFGGGPYTQFAFWGQLKGATPERNPYMHTFTDEQGEEVFALSDNHSGLSAYLGYEFACGLQINASYQIALSDMFVFEHDRSTFLLPQKATLGLGYRF